MNCKEFERTIPGFINRKIDFPTMRSFADHLNSCADCKEELTIQFLVAEGMQHLEEGDSFDLQKELKSRMDEAHAAMKLQVRLKKSGMALELAGMAIGAFALVWLFLS